ncbi:AAA ATPase [Blyttiomyces sp. JEL0837]|nr:AAA ATPase [Blyttiomyces sp. JEL0837]
MLTISAQPQPSPTSTKRKHLQQQSTPSSIQNAIKIPNTNTTNNTSSTQPQKRRGRPPKNPTKPIDVDSENDNDNGMSDLDQMKSRKRVRRDEEIEEGGEEEEVEDGGVVVMLGRDQDGDEEGEEEKNETENDVKVVKGGSARRVLGDFTNRVSSPAIKSPSAKRARGTITTTTANKSITSTPTTTSTKQSHTKQNDLPAPTPSRLSPRTLSKMQAKADEVDAGADAGESQVAKANVKPKPKAIAYAKGGKRGRPRKVAKMVEDDVLDDNGEGEGEDHVDQSEESEEEDEDDDRDESFHDAEEFGGSGEEENEDEESEQDESEDESDDNEEDEDFKVSRSGGRKRRGSRGGGGSPGTGTKRRSPRGKPVASAAAKRGVVKSPATPRGRGRSKNVLDSNNNNNTSTPKSQIRSGVVGDVTTGGNGTPRTPRTPSSVYKDAKSLFKASSAPLRLVGREGERDSVRGFLRGVFGGESGGGESGSLYMSGCPGTGKTALLDEVLWELRDEMEEANVVVVKINCMTISEARSIYGRIMAGFGVEVGDFDTLKQEPYRALEKFFTQGAGDSNKKGKGKGKKEKRRERHLLVLDEIDHLASRDQEVLYRIFEWPTLENSSLVLVGIANAIDLLSRYLPRLGGRNGSPQMLNFKPYEVKEIAEIIKGRLMELTTVIPDDDEEFTAEANENQENQQPVVKSLSGAAAVVGGVVGKRLLPVMQESAIEMCARKAAGTGDLRKALDVCRMAIEVAEMDMKRGEEIAKAKAKSGNVNIVGNGVGGGNIIGLNSPVKSIDEVPRVSVAHVIRATAAVSGPGPSQRVAGLSVQQKAVLVALLVVGRKARPDEMMIGRLHETYSQLCAQKKVLTKVSRSEFGDILSLLETLGLLSIGKAKEQRDRRVTLSVLPGQVEAGLASDTLLVGLMRDLLGSTAKVV